MGKLGTSEIINKRKASRCANINFLKELDFVVYENCVWIGSKPSVSLKEPAGLGFKVTFYLSEGWVKEISECLMTRVNENIHR